MDIPIVKDESRNTPIDIPPPTPPVHRDRSRALQMASMITVFRANPFAINDDPSPTVSESIVDGQHGPLLHPPVFIEFAISDLTNSSLSDIKLLAVSPPAVLDQPTPSHRPRKRLLPIQAAHNPPTPPPPTLYANLSSAPLLPTPLSHALSATVRPPLSLGETLPSSSAGPSTLTDTLSTPSFEGYSWFPMLHQIGAPTPTRWIPSSLASRKNAHQLKSCPSFDIAGTVLLACANISIPLSPKSCPLSPVTNANLQPHLASVWPYHPFEWRGLPGPNPVVTFTWAIV